jgi:hypothetical protein
MRTEDLMEEEHSGARDAGPEHLIGYYRPAVLAAYQAEPHKYSVETDYFEGNIKISQTYHEAAPEAALEDIINVQFGYRTLFNGDLAIAAYLPDLKRSKPHFEQWKPFELTEPAWTEGDDERWTLWQRRYFGGGWDVYNGPRLQLADTMQTMNALTMETVGTALFSTGESPAPWTSVESTDSELASVRLAVS